MDKNFEAQYHELEERHWWFRARRDAIMELLSSVDLPKDARILEIGCSGGSLMRRLVDLGFEHVFGLDVSEEGVVLARQRGLSKVAVMNGAQLALAGTKFDLVIASDVLEHIEFDTNALREWHRVMRAGGWLIVFVPAFMQLWSSHDEVNYHRRRYRRTQLCSLLEQSDFTVARAAYWNSMLFAPIAAIRLMRRHFLRGLRSATTDDLSPPNKLLNAILYGLLKVENRLLVRGFDFPLGISVWALAQKPSSSNCREESAT